MYFQYDSNGTPLGLVWNGTQYFYETNQMGDVIGIADSSGYEIIQYDYDEWGNETDFYIVNYGNASQCTLANINPLRYRGYYLDSETGYYYLQSRYYDPSICRFINADVYIIAEISKEIYTGLNIFPYCNNNPINSEDYTGYYSTSKAKTYADRWWHSRNTSKYKTNSADCANFVSQCLYAGELSSMTGVGSAGWHHYKVGNQFQISNAWGIAKDLYSWLVKNHSSSVKSFTNKSTLNTYLKGIYSKYSYCSYAVFFDWTNDNKIDHAALSGEVTKNGSKYNMYYYAHVSNRAGRKRYYDENKYTPNQYKLYNLATAMDDNPGCKIYLVKLK